MMAEISLGSFLALVLSELTEALAQTQQHSETVSLMVQNLELDIPARLRLEIAVPSVSPAASAAAARTARLMIIMPSTRETSSPGNLGRLRLVIEPIPELRDGPVLAAAAAED